MKFATKQLIIASMLATLGLAASAQTPPPGAGPGMGPGMGMGAGPMAREGQRGMDPARMQERAARMQERMAKRLAAFKQKLQITAAQEGAWNTFAAALKPTPMQRPDRAEMAKLSTPERIDRMRALRTSHMAEMDKRADATKVFYATLTPEQKKVFDDTTARFQRRAGMGGMGAMDGGRGHHGHHRI